MVAHVNMTITDQGMANLINDEHNGFNKILLHRISFGTGRYTPDSTATALTEQVAEATTVAGNADGADAIQVTGIDQGDGAYSLYEIGLWGQLVDESDNTVDGSEFLFAVYSDPTADPVLVKESSSAAYVVCSVALVQGASTSITFSNFSIVLPEATETVAGTVRIATLEEALAGEEGSAVLTPYTLGQLIENAGGVSVSDSIAKWDSSTAYASGVLAYTVYNGYLYVAQSLQDNNLGNDIVNSSGYWSVLDMSSSLVIEEEHAVSSEVQWVQNDDGTWSGTVTNYIGDTVTYLGITGTVDSSGTFTGTVDGYDNSEVTGTLVDGLFNGTIFAETEDGSEYDITVVDNVGTGTYTSIQAITLAGLASYVTQAETRYSSFISNGTIAVPGEIGTAGFQGFGVGIHSDETTVADNYGLFPMPGCHDPDSPMYGNYGSSSAGKFVYVPKHYYRYGYKGSLNYATYGANALDVCSQLEYDAMSSAEQATGWFLPRVFIDGGAEQDGYFFSKYLAYYSSTLGVAVSDSIWDPTGSVTAANALSYAKAVDGFTCPSVFMCADIALLAFAHKQAATTTRWCSWLNTEYGMPRRYDEAVFGTYTRDIILGDGAYLFNSHNGQVCGVMDLGFLRSLALGMVTDSGASGSLYLMQRSKSLLSFTGGSSSSTDFLGTASSLTSGMYYALDIVSSGTLTATQGYWGNGSEPLFTDPSTDEGLDLFGVLPRSDASLGTRGGGGIDGYVSTLSLSSASCVWQAMGTQWQAYRGTPFGGYLMSATAAQAYNGFRLATYAN